MDMMRPIALNVESTIPNAPVLSSTMPSSTQINLSWTDTTPVEYVTRAGFGDPKSEIGFRIERATGAGAFAQIGAALANVTTYNDTTVVPNTTYRYRVIAYNAAGDATSNTISIVPLAITTTTLPNGTVGVAYNQTLAATGGLTPYTWSISAGALPTPLTLNPTTGVISGTPNVAGTFNFTVMVTDAATRTATRALSITVAATPVSTLAIDRVVFFDRNTTGNTVAAPSLTTTGTNRLLLAFVSADAPATGTNTRVTGITNNGAALTWVLVRRTNTQRGTAEIWRAFAPTVRTLTVTARFNQSIPASSITVVAFSGTDTSGANGSGAIGATASGSSAAGAPTASLVTTRANSWVFGVGTDWDNAIPRTLGPNQTMVHQGLATVGDTYWVQRQTNTTPAAGTTVTINDTAPTTDRYNLTIVEVRTP